MMKYKKSNLLVALMFISSAAGAETVLGSGATGGGAFSNGIAVGVNAAASGTGTFFGTITTGGVAVGNSASAGSSSVAVGAATTATAVQSTALGTTASAAATGSTVIGYSATVTAAGTNSVALGNGSRATEADVVSVGGGSGMPGQGPVTRRIVGVADGINATDAATKGQLDGINASVNTLINNLTNSTDSQFFAVNNDIQTLYSQIGGGGGGSSIGTYDAGANTINMTGNGVDPVRLSNIAAPIAATDAANKDYVDTQVSGAVSGLRSEISGLRSDVYRGLAQAAALMPMAPSGPGESTVNVGIGSYAGYQAVGFSFAHQHKNTTYSAGFSQAMGGGPALIRAGAGWRFN